MDLKQFEFIFFPKSNIDKGKNAQDGKFGIFEKCQHFV